MTDAQIEVCDDLWREALAAGLVRWMPGMGAAWKPRGGAGGQQVLPTFARVCDLPMGPMPLTYCVVDAAHVYATASPVWTDPATTGCLLALAREATGCHTHSASYYAQLDAWAYDWNRADGSPVDGVLSMTEPEALLRAILATRGDR